MLKPTRLKQEVASLVVAANNFFKNYVFDTLDPAHRNLIYSQFNACSKCENLEKQNYGI